MTSSLASASVPAATTAGPVISEDGFDKVEATHCGADGYFRSR
jgi:hypothetical protein